MQLAINGLLANYEILNSNGKESIIILHGWGRTFKEWVPLAKLLSTRYKLILLDLPGFGNSFLPKDRELGISDYAFFVETFLEKLRIKDVILLGHSFGGKVGIALASKSRKINKLFLIDTSGVSEKSLKTKIIIKSLKLLKKIFQFSPTIQDKIGFFLGSEDYKKSGSLRKTFKKVVSENISLSAKRIKVQTVIIWGENDKEVPVSSAKKLYALIPNSWIRIVWGAKHNPHLEDPQKFIGILQDYL